YGHTTLSTRQSHPSTNQARHCHSHTTRGEERKKGGRRKERKKKGKGGEKRRKGFCMAKYSMSKVFNVDVHHKLFLKHLTSDFVCITMRAEVSSSSPPPCRQLSFLYFTQNPYTFFVTTQ